MIPKEISDEMWERMFAMAKSPFSREDVAQVLDMRHSPVDTNEMTSIGIFLLKDGSFGVIAGKCSPTWNEVLKADCLHCSEGMIEIIFSFYKSGRDWSRPFPM